MSFWLSATPLQEPFDLGPDAGGRSQWSVNVFATKTESRTFVDECIAVLADAGVGVPSETLFAGTEAAIPEEGDGPFLFVTGTGGLPRVRTHGTDYPRPTAQLIAVGADVAATIELIESARDALIAVQNAEVAPYQA